MTEVGFSCHGYGGYPHHCRVFSLNNLEIFRAANFLCMEGFPALTFLLHSITPQWTQHELRTRGTVFSWECASGQQLSQAKWKPTFRHFPVKLRFMHFLIPSYANISQTKFYGKIFCRSWDMAVRVPATEEEKLRICKFLGLPFSVLCLLQHN